MTTTEQIPFKAKVGNLHLTERDLLDLLRARYGRDYGNGARYVTAEHVRSHAGFDARRTADFIALDTWPSSDLALHGHEVKVSRSDWLTELKNPWKAAEFTPYMTYWWVVVSDRSLIHDAELPDGWGLIAVRGAATQKLAVVRQARKQKPEPLPRTMTAALMRAVAKTARLR